LQEIAVASSRTEGRTLKRIHFLRWT
jgi:hypothetical protein